MDEIEQVPTWQLRLLGGAVGAFVAIIATLITLPTFFLAIVGAVGIPVGMIIGLVAGPRLVKTDRPDGAAVGLSVVAALLGVSYFVASATLQEARGASLVDLLEFAMTRFMFYGLFGLALGWPMAVFVALFAMRLLRRLAPRAGRLWLPSGVLVALIGFGTLTGVVSALQGSGNQAAGFSDTIAIDFRVINRTSRDYMLQIRADVNGSSNSYVAPCGLGSGSDSLQGEWAIWIGDDDASWVDRPAGMPVLSSAEHPRGQDLDITILIGSDGVASVWRQGEAPPPPVTGDC